MKGILLCIGIIIKFILAVLLGKAGESIEIRHGKLYKDDRQVNKYYAKNRDINDFALRDLENTDGDIIHLTHF